MTCSNFLGCSSTCKEKVWGQFEGFELQNRHVWELKVTEIVTLAARNKAAAAM